MTAVTDLIAELLGNRYSSGVQDIRADVDTFVLAFLALSGGTGVAPGLVGVQAFSASDTYIPTSGTRQLLAMVWGGAGGAGGAATGGGAAVNVGGGGGSGAFRFAFLVGVVQASYAVTIGAGGAGGTSAGTDGSAGGTTSLVANAGTANLSAVGGLGGIGDATGGIGPKLTLGAGRNSGGTTTQWLSLISNEASSGGNGVALSLATGWGGDGAGAGLGSIFTQGTVIDGGGTNGRSQSSGGSGARAVAAGRAGGAGNGGRCVIFEFTGGA